MAQSSRMNTHGGGRAVASASISIALGTKMQPLSIISGRPISPFHISSTEIIPTVENTIAMDAVFLTFQQVRACNRALANASFTDLKLLLRCFECCAVRSHKLRYVVRYECFHSISSSGFQQDQRRTAPRWKEPCRFCQSSAIQASGGFERYHSWSQWRMRTRHGVQMLCRMGSSYWFGNAKLS